MKFVNRLIALLALILVLLIGVFFAVQNTRPVPLDLLIISLPERPLALWVLLAFATGGVIGMLTSIGAVWRLRAGLLSANRKLKALQSRQPDNQREQE